MEFKAVYFDLDGTLVNSLDDLADATNHMLSGMNRPTLTKPAVRRLLGRGVRDLVAKALQSDSATEIESGVKLFIDFNIRHIADKSRLYPGVIETLDKLSDRGVRLAVISNKNEELSRLILKSLAVDHYFQNICGGDTFSEMKPSPLPLLRVSEMIGITPDQAVMVGDSINDILAGKTAGIKTIACTWGFGGQEGFINADYLAGSCPDLDKLLHQQAN